MDIVNQLRQSSIRLKAIEKKLDIERDNLINHPSNNANLSNNSTYFPYLSTVDKYAGFADEYRKELVIFKDLLQKTTTTGIQKNNSNTSTINNEITSNYLPTKILSCPVVNPKIEQTYIYTNGSNESTTSPRNSTNSNIIKQSSNDTLISDEKTLQLPKIQPLPPQKIQPLPPQKIKKTIKAKIINRISYKYEQKGFDIWKRNGQRPIYSMTELYCSKTFGKDKNGILKLKKYLITKGGFKTNAIENIKILNNSLNNNKFGLIIVRDRRENIIDCMNKINDISIYKRRTNQNIKQNKTLHVKNFDILSGKDHRKLTDLFLRFGELETHIFINKDRLGNLYAFVQYSNIKCAIECERNQNMNSYRRYNNPLWFNGRRLQIEFAGNTIKNNKKNKKSKNNYSKK